jgi:hypothetical protein
MNLTSLIIHDTNTNMLITDTKTAKLLFTNKKLMSFDHKLTFQI